MKNNRYLDYKDSRYEWLGEIPLHWELKRAKWGFQEKSIKGYPEETLLSVSKGKGVIPRDKLENKTVMAFKDLENFKLVVPEDFVIHLRSFQSGFELSTNKGIVSPAYTVFSCRSNLAPKYYKFLFYTQSFIDAIASTTQSLRDGKPIAYKDFSDMELPYPPLSEQIKIANYLEVQLARIDNLIDMKEKLILLLNNQRQSIITEAVIKGLNPKVKMKYSGVDWIGQIPEHWKLVKIKHLLVSKKGAIKTGPFGSQLTNNDMNGNDVKIYNQRTVLDNDFVKGDYYISKEKYEELKSFEVYSRDILITTRGTIGKAAIVPNNIECGILHPCLIRMQLCSNLIELKLVQIIFNETNFIKKQIELLSNATTIEVIYSETLKNLSIVLPSKYEQQELLIYIENILKDYNGIICNQKKQIEKLKEYRQSLIYEAVTGKIDVRDMELD